MSDDHKHLPPPLPRVDSDVHTAQTVVAESAILAAVQKAILQVGVSFGNKIDEHSRSVESKIDAQTKLFNRMLDEQSRELGERLDDAERSAKDRGETVSSLATLVQEVVVRVGKLEDAGGHPSMGPPRTKSGFTTAVSGIAGEVAVRTVSEADSKLEATVGLVKSAVERLERETKDSLKAQDVVLTKHTTELASQTTTLNAVNTTTAVLGAKAVDIATDTKKLAGWKYNPIFQLVVLSFVVSILAAIFGHYGVPFVVAPH